MTELSAAITLRPARIALLVRPSDRKSIIRFMRLSVCMWGGEHNPIVPVFRRPPKEWAREFRGDSTGHEIARGYVRFFEPDAFVEAEPGLVEEAGLDGVRDGIGFRSRVISLDELLEVEPNRHDAYLKLGLSVTDIFQEKYSTEQRFQLRDPVASIRIDSPPRSGLAEAMFGVHPAEAGAEYFGEIYENVFRPDSAACDVTTWRKVFLNRTITPLRVTRHGIQHQRTWMDDLSIFVFDPSRPTDLIDLWNLRSEPSPVLPVPVAWFLDLVPELQQIIGTEYRPLEGNPHGVMRSATVEFSRGVPPEKQQEMIDLLVPGIPSRQGGDGPGSLGVKSWRNRIWDKATRGMMPSPSRLKVIADERRTSVEIDEEGERPSGNLETLSPDFVSQFGHSQLRWINSVRVSNYGSSRVATIYPYNTFDRSNPRLVFGVEDVMIGTEGWSLGAQYTNHSTMLRLESQEHAIIGFLKRQGITAEMSEPGHIAKQMLEHLGGLWGAWLIAHEATLRMLNDMAGAVRRRRNSDEEILEQFDPRSRPVKAWSDLISKRTEGTYQEIKLDDFTSKNVLRIGLETKCPHCTSSNWDALDRLSYELTCERCLKKYPFPQGAVTKWAYRVVGPFSVQDFGRGSYGAVLALRTLSEMTTSFRSINYSTALTLRFDGKVREADYICFHQADDVGTAYAPDVVIGEAKSFGEKDTIKPKDIALLKELALRMPGAYLAVSILRTSFSDRERDLLRSLVRWSRKLGEDGWPRNRVLLMTGVELLRRHEPLQSTWKSAGGEHAKFADYNHTRNLSAIAEASIAIHLQLPSFETERHAAYARRKKRGGDDFLRIPGRWGKIGQTVSGPEPAE